jgi:rhomboid protease GluP
MGAVNGGIAFKIRYLCVPLFALAAAVLVGYSLLNWALVARTNLVPLSDNVVDYWIPLGASWVLVLFLIQPALGLLKRDKRGNLPVLYHAAAVAVVAVPTFVAQGYIRTATGDLTRVKEMGEIASAAVTKYYAADSVCVDYKASLFAPVVSTSGRNNEWINVDLYDAEPLCPRKDTDAKNQAVWIGIVSHTSFSSSLSRSEREAAYKAFLQRADTQFRQEDPQSYRFFERVGRNADAKGFGAALRHGLTPDAVTAAIVLVPHKEAFEQRTGNRLAWTFGSPAIGAFGWFVLVLLGPLDPEKVKRRLESGRGSNSVDKRGLLEFVVPRRGDYGLPILIDVNILVFVAMVLAGIGFGSFDTEDLIAWGGNYRPALHGLGVFRLITSQFVHGGIMHLLGNLFGLLLAGLILLPIVGNGGLILCYVLAGIGASIASDVVHPTGVSVGASGAIFGLFGTLLTLLCLRDESLGSSRMALLFSAGAYVAVNLVLGLISRTTDNAAHVGGLATGAVLGLAIFAAKRANMWKRSAVAD